MALRYPKDQGTEWMNLKREVKNAFTSANSRVPYQKIGAGILQVFQSLQMQAGAFMSFNHENGELGLFLGRHVSGPDAVDGWFMQRADGSLSFWSYTRVSDGYGYTAIYDREGNVILSDDAVEEKGLARPWIPWSTEDWASLVNPPASRVTSNTTDTDMIISHTNAQHPVVRYAMYIRAATATCEVKFWSYPDNTLLHSVTVGDGWTLGDFNLGSWDYGISYYMKVSIRRASGTGSVGITLVSLMGKQN